MKLLKKLLIILLILILIAGSLLFIIGFSYYSKVLKEKTLIERVEEFTSKEHYMTYEQLT